MRWILPLFVMALGLGADAPSSAKASEGKQEKKKAKIALPKDSLYLLQTRTLDGTAVNLQDYAGQVTLIVNLASQ